MKKYVLHPGWVRSAKDNDKHFIDAPSLAAIYGVQMKDCIVDRDNPFIWRGREYDDFIHLHVQYNEASYERIRKHIHDRG